MNKALLVGINEYKKTPLYGCVNDVVDMARFLTENCKWKAEEIRLLTDSRATKTAIINRLFWLIKDLNQGDNILFHYSGHGTQIPTRNKNDEIDGLDEAICPYDFTWGWDAGKTTAILDNEFYEIFKNIPAGVNAIWVSDSCHSGDLTRDINKPRHNGVSHYVSSKKFMERPADVEWRFNVTREKKIKLGKFSSVNNITNIILLSACRVDQVSLDVNFGDQKNGLFTRVLLEILKIRRSPIGDILKEVMERIRSMGYTQEPQIECVSTRLNDSFF